MLFVRDKRRGKENNDQWEALEEERQDEALLFSLP